MAGNISTLGLGGNGVVSAIHNHFSSGGVGSANNLNAIEDTNTKQILSGALTQDALASVLTVTGHGVLNIATVYTMDTTSRTARGQIIVDGRTIFDATTSALTSQYKGMIMVGVLDAGSSPVGTVFQPIEFRQSLVIKVASSVSPGETDKLAIGVNYEVWV